MHTTEIKPYTLREKKTSLDIITGLDSEFIDEILEATQADIEESQSSRHHTLKDPKTRAQVYDQLGLVSEFIEEYQDVSLDTFLYPEVTISVYDQLKLMSEFWAMSGYKMPVLSEEQVTMLASILKAYPHYRVIPAPILSADDREALIVECTRQFKKDMQADDHWAVDNGGAYGRLLKDSESQVIEEGSRHTSTHNLRYKVVGGKLVSREAYVDGLAKMGNLVAGEKGLQWTLSVMDIRAERKMTERESLADIYRNDNPFDSRLTVSPACTTETILAVHLLHQANNTSSDRLEIDLSNESVLVGFERSDCRFSRNYIEPVGVSCSPEGRKVGVTRWYTDVAEARCSTRDAISGIMTPRRFESSVRLSKRLLDIYDEDY